jgi:hypothetical protein
VTGVATFPAEKNLIIAVMTLRAMASTHEDVVANWIDAGCPPPIARAHLAVAAVQRLGSLSLHRIQGMRVVL